MIKLLLKTTLIFYYVFFLALLGCGSKRSGVNDSPPPSAEKPKDGGNPNQPNTREEKKDFEFQSFGIIREFGVNDRAAMFGIYSKVGKLQIIKVVGPSFLISYRAGELNQTSLSKLFLNSSAPLSADEKQSLISKFNGATVIYTEGYSDYLCNYDEISYEIQATGRINDTDIEIIFRFEALPNSIGNCNFHTFETITHYIK